MVKGVLTVVAALGAAAVVGWMFALKHHHPVIERDVGKTFRIIRAKKRSAHLVCVDTNKEHVISYPPGFVCKEGEEYQLVKTKDGRLHLEKIAPNTK